MEEMYDEFNLVPDDPDTINWLYYVDRVEESLEPGKDPKKSKYIDPVTGLPIAPKSYKDLLSRGDDPSVQMWLDAGETEWAGLIAECRGTVSSPLSHCCGGTVHALPSFCL